MISDGMRAARLGRPPPPASSRAISRMFWNSRSSRSTSAWMSSVCSASLASGDSRRLQVGGGDANRGQRRPQIVAERGQQRRLQLLALAGRAPRPCAPRETARARCRWPRRRPAHRGCRPPPAARRRPAGRSAGCRPAAAPAARARRRSHRPVPGVGARVGVELEGRSGPPRTPRPVRGCRAPSTRRPRRRPTPSSRGSAMATYVEVETPGDRARASVARASRLSVVSSTSRLRSKSRASSSRRPTLRWPAPRATADRLLATRLTARKANSATQFCGSAMVKVPTGGRKTKLKPASPRSTWSPPPTACEWPPRPGRPAARRSRWWRRWRPAASG